MTKVEISGAGKGLRTTRPGGLRELTPLGRASAIRFTTQPALVAPCLYGVILHSLAIITVTISVFRFVHCGRVAERESRFRPRYGPVDGKSSVSRKTRTTDLPNFRKLPGSFTILKLLKIRVVFIPQASRPRNEQRSTSRASRPCWEASATTPA